MHSGKPLSYLLKIILSSKHHTHPPSPPTEDSSAATTSHKPTNTSSHTPSHLSIGNPPPPSFLPRTSSPPPPVSPPFRSFRLFWSLRSFWSVRYLRPFRPNIIRTQSPSCPPKKISTTLCSIKKSYYFCSRKFTLEHYVSLGGLSNMKFLAMLLT